eukprot:CAMPEP_0181204674 /NCGR_PEP_ID=MMETSP1096-20121128/20064_1 /TAXON_ID=156174 ORGANISM="Chrysochromulina ericina, Strain CCMP281" /NCGR_SAMPLE_ID=MMETSP1096 /ASSEMBLY_ACC=CAM_ASM_000453 /LENGTH=52 /DNA_ID=CAMNT_0023295395 /DNA_START=587 /DNA_END=741 /DNA_ORIENTATION=+
MCHSEDASRSAVWTPVTKNFGLMENWSVAEVGVMCRRGRNLIVLSLSVVKSS